MNTRAIAAARARRHALEPDRFFRPETPPGHLERKHPESRHRVMTFFRIRARPDD
ncbi:hypothetical protein [Burkholderia anthina]|uniref:hypothetical protein n=1 Tax=Burkholderia anthina TaxID=179879 RepID=UPI000A7B8198|nr:hypothetical protein [Burkholderia anthina]